MCSPVIAFAGPPLEERAPAGIVERQIQEEYQDKPISPDKDIPLLEIDLPKEQLSISSDKTILIQEIVFIGNTELPNKELLKLVKSECNRNLKMTDIQCICLKIQNEYRKQGYFLARAFPPPQEIRDGILTIQIMEGLLGEVDVVDNKHYATAKIASYFNDLAGKPLHHGQFLKRMLLLNENPALKAGAIFKKGAQVGTADLTIRIEDSVPLSFYTDYNNYGSSFTTRGRVGAKLNLGNLPVNASQVMVTQVQGLPFNELTFSQVTLHLPIWNPMGIALEGSYLYSRFHVPPFSSLDVSGGTHIGTLRYLQPIARTRNLSADFSASFDWKDIRNYALGKAASIDILRMLGCGVDVDYIDPWGRTYFESYLYYAIPNLWGASPVVNSQSSHPGAGSRFFKCTGSVKRLQRLINDYFLMLNITGQWASQKIPIAEEIYIGGVDTVRGFLPAVGLGDMGFYINCEFRLPPPGLGSKKIFFCQKKTWGEILQFVCFIDHGTVFFKQSDGTIRTSLTGAGLGGRLFGFWHFNASVDVGFPIQSDVSPTSTVTYARVSWDYKF